MARFDILVTIFVIGDGLRLKVPHMGWNQVSQTIDHPLWKDVPDNSRFYFVHSYYVQTQQRGMDLQD